MLRILLILIVLATKTYAQTLPRLTHHSEPLINVSQGDIVVLRSQLEDQSRVLWYSATRQLCEGTVCRIDTSSWSIGQHRIVLIAINQFGSKVVDYHLQVTQPKPQIPPQTLAVPMVTAIVSADSVGQDQDYVISKANTGFSYRSDTPHLAQAKLQIVRNFPRKLDWNENLRSSTGHLKFGRLGSDEHYLWPGGQLQLIKLQDEARIIVLQKGILRSRTIRAKAASSKISILASNWLQVDGLASADFVIEMPDVEGTRASIHVLRGEVQVRWRDPLVALDVFGELSVDERAEEQRLLTDSKDLVYFIAAGQRLEITKDQDHRPGIFPLLTKETEKFLMETTPHLWDVEGESDEYKQSNLGSGQFLEAARLTDAAEGDPKQQLQAARSAVQEHDYLEALERLSHAKSLQTSFDWQLIAGIAYDGLSQPKRTARHLRRANELQPNDPELAYLLGKTLIIQGHWQQAELWLRKALVGDKQPSDFIHYYLGVAAYSRGDWALSRRYFSLVVRDSDRSDLLISSRKYLQILIEKQDFLASASLSALYDSNIFGVAKESTIRTYDANLAPSGLGYHGSAAVEKRFALQRPVDWALRGKIARRGWLAEALREADRVDQMVGARLRTGSQKQWSLGLELESILIGSRRALDGIGLTFSHRFSKRFARPTLSFGHKRYQDPLPADADLLDPLSEEWQAVPSDRSSVVSYLQLSFAGELDSQWVYSIDSELWQRTLTEVLARGLNEKRLGLRGQLKWRWQSGLDLLVALGLRQRQYPEADTNRQDFQVETAAGLDWYFMDRWRWLGLVQFQEQNSSQDEFRFSRIVTHSGVAYQF